MTYHEHPSKVVRLDAAGVLVDYTPAHEEDCTVWFAIPDSPGDWEGVLGRRVEAHRVEIVGLPIFVYDTNLGDEVQVMKSGEGADVARRVTSASGNVTFRAAFEESRRPDHHWRSPIADLSPHECWFDTWSETLIAISAPSGSAQAVADYLAQREERGELTYETGRRSGAFRKRLRSPTSRHQPARAPTDSSGSGATGPRADWLPARCTAPDE